MDGRLETFSAASFDACCYCIPTHHLNPQSLNCDSVKIVACMFQSQASFMGCCRLLRVKGQFCVFLVQFE